MHAILLLVPLLVASPARAADTDGDGVDSVLDCDDTRADVFPGAEERCNTVDDNCDGNVDEASSTDATLWYRDGDGDGAGDAGRTVIACAEPVGHVADATDCDDTDASVSPSVAEVCDGADNDCDGDIDEAGAVGSGTWYADADGDLFGDASTPVSACERPDGVVIDATDCDDANADVFPGAPEVFDDGVDADCDGLDGDADGDGFDSVASGGEDCDDLDPAVFPGAEDAPYDGVDADCAQDDDFDADGDGHVAVAWGGDDCDDADGAVFPGAEDAAYDGASTDCTPADDDDVDHDGFASSEVGGADCDDGDASVNPGMPETWYDGVDSDCDGNDDDQDGDGFVLADDCDDEDALGYPGSGTYDDACVPLGRKITEGNFQGGGGCATAPSIPSAGLLGALAAVGLLIRRRR